MLAFLDNRGIAGATVLEVGGGVGELQIELLKRGAAHAVNLELSHGYDAEASRLLRENGLADKVERRIHDIAAAPGDVEPADVVVLHRVVCCYPDYERLLEAAAEHARRVLVFSYPPRNVVSRLVVAAENTLFRLLRKEYRAFAHPPSAMLAVLGDNGLRPTFAHRGLAWRVTGLEREMTDS
jgi:2-polyprenyl-3-methyl-5-hydroxy-6-metoxy-1,4-benzoquinol methylase